MAVPLSSNLPWELANNIWAQAINPVINNQIVQGALIQNVVTKNGINKIINHGLNRMMIGWFVVDNTENCNVWRVDTLNSKTLTIKTSADTTLSLWVF